MQINRLSFSFLLLSLGLVTSAGCSAGLSVQPKVPTFEAQAELPLATVDASTTMAYAEPAPQAVAPQVVAPQAVSNPQGQFARSGGATAETAQLVKVGDTITGTVTKGVPVYYAIDLQAAQPIELNFLLRKFEGGYVSFKYRLVDPDKILVNSGSELIRGELSERTRAQMMGTTTATGRHLLKLTANYGVGYQLQIVDKANTF